MSLSHSFLVLQNEFLVRDTGQLANRLRGIRPVSGTHHPPDVGHEGDEDDEQQCASYSMLELNAVPINNAVENALSADV